MAVVPTDHEPGTLPIPPGYDWADWMGDVETDPCGPSSGIVGFQSTIADGALALALPDYEALTVESSIGPGAIVAVGQLEITMDGAYTVEARAIVHHSYGQYVVFGASKNGNPPIEIGRAAVNSNDPLFVISNRSIINLVAGDVIQFFISSTFEWQDFSWTDVEVLGVIAQ